MSPSTVVTCVRCARELPRDGGFCPWCGAPRSAAAVDLVLDITNAEGTGAAPSSDRGRREGRPGARSARRRWGRAGIGLVATATLAFSAWRLLAPDDASDSVPGASGTTAPGDGSSTSGAPAGSAGDDTRLGVDDTLAPGDAVAVADTNVPDGLRGQAAHVVTDRGTAVAFTFGETEGVVEETPLLSATRSVLASRHGVVVRDAAGAAWLREPGGGTARIGEGRAVVGTERLWSWDASGGLSTAPTRLIPWSRPGELERPEPWTIGALTVPVGVSDAGLLAYLPVTGQLFLQSADGEFTLVATGRLLGGAADVALLSSCSFEGCELVAARSDGTARPVGASPDVPRARGLAHGDEAVVSPDGARVVAALDTTSSVVVQLARPGAGPAVAVPDALAAGIRSANAVWDATSRYVLVPAGDGVLALDAVSGGAATIPVAVPAGEEIVAVVPVAGQ